MIKTLRIAGFAMMVLGVIVLLTWLFEPLRALWPWLLALPVPVQIGFGIATLGVTILFSSLVLERWQERDLDKRLKEDQ